MLDFPEPLIAPDRQLPELTFKVIILSIILTILLAASNAYLALKIGLLTSASIPAAVISMGILKLFRNSNILENNLVQTAASAGEAVAGGIVYSVPALIIIRYWLHFPYLECVAIALLSGILGVLFSIPLRRLLMTAPHLRFPEGRAIAEVLKVGTVKALGFKEMLWGTVVGALLELAQTGFKLVANNLEVWFTARRALFGFGAGFSPAMIGAGYLIGPNFAFSLLIGAGVGWLFGIPIVSELYPVSLENTSAAHAVMTLWGEKVRYIGIGTMLVTGLWTLITLAKPFYDSLRIAIQGVTTRERGDVPRTELDMPFKIVIVGILIVLALMYVLFHYIFPLDSLVIGNIESASFILACLFYVLIIGFIISALTAYFSGLVGVTATPGAAVVILGFLLAGLMLDLFLTVHGSPTIDQAKFDATIIALILGSVIIGAAAISNDTMQDLKVGHIVGSTPWKQQLMLMLGVVVSAFIIPVVMELLFNVYGIAGVFPREGMDPTQTLAAPPAAMFSAVTQAVFKHSLPWNMMFVGGAIAFLCIALNQLLKKEWGKRISVLGIGMGIYLPLASSTPIIFGGFIAYIAHRARSKAKPEAKAENKHRAVVIACGLVAGAALMDVVLAIPFSIFQSPDVLRLLPEGWALLAGFLALLSTFGLGYWFYRVSTNESSD